MIRILIRIGLHRITLAVNVVSVRLRLTARTFQSMSQQYIKTVLARFQSKIFITCKIFLLATFLVLVYKTVILILSILLFIPLLTYYHPEIKSMEKREDPANITGPQSLQHLRVDGDEQEKATTATTTAALLGLGQSDQHLRREGELAEWVLR